MDDRERASNVVGVWYDEYPSIHIPDEAEGQLLEKIAKLITLVREEAERKGFERGLEDALKLVERGCVFNEYGIVETTDEAIREVLRALRTETSNQTEEK